MPGRQDGVTKEALLRLPELDLRELQEPWCRLYKTYHLGLDGLAGPAKR